MDLEDHVNKLEDQSHAIGGSESRNWKIGVKELKDRSHGIQEINSGVRKHLFAFFGLVVKKVQPIGFVLEK